MNTNSNSSKTNPKADGNRAPVGAEAGLQEKIMKQIRELGDTLERAGEKVEKNGWETIGQAIYKLGNTLEHLNKDDKKSSPSTSLKGKVGYSDREFDEKSKNFPDSKASVTKVGGSDSQAF